MGFIYLIKNKINGKVYVDKTNKRDANSRWLEHIKDLSLNKHYNNHLQIAWNKYGDINFDFSVLEISNDVNEREKYWIEQYKSSDPKFGYNKTLGGDGGAPNEEIRCKMVINNTGIKNPMYGKKHSQDSIEKMRNIKLGKNNPMYGRIPSKQAIERIIACNIQRRGKKLSHSVRKKISESQSGEKNSMYGKKHSKETIEKMKAAGKANATRGEFKLTPENILAIYKRANAGENQRILSIEYGVSIGMISKIKLGKKYRELTNNIK